MNAESVIKPEGHIGMYLHKGGIFVPEKQAIIGGDVIKEDHFKNLIVNRASIFMARRMIPTSNIANGIQYLAVGVDYGTGSAQSPQAEDATYIKLRNELSRKLYSDWNFLDASGNSLGKSTPSNVVQYIFTFLTTEANGGLVEMGLFGGDSTTAKDSGQMFNYKVFPIWNKTSDVELTITWKITF